MAVLVGRTSEGTRDCSRPTALDGVVESAGFTAVASGAAAKAWVYGYTANNRGVKVVVFKDGTAAPIGISSEIILPASAGWASGDITLSENIASGTKYYLAMVFYASWDAWVMTTEAVWNGDQLIGTWNYADPSGARLNNPLETDVGWAQMSVYLASADAAPAPSSLLSLLGVG